MITKSKNMENKTKLSVHEMFTFITDQFMRTKVPGNYQLFTEKSEEYFAIRMIATSDEELIAIKKIRHCVRGRFHVPGQEIRIKEVTNDEKQYLILNFRFADSVYLSEQLRFSILEPCSVKKYIYYGGHTLLTEGFGGRVWPITMKDLFDGNGKFLLKELLNENIMRYFATENRIWSDLADDLLAGSAYSAIPSSRIWECHSRQELIEKHYGASLKRNNKEPIGNGIFLAKAKSVVIENDLQKLFGFSPGRIYIGRKKTDLAESLANFIYANIAGSKCVNMPHGYRLTITPDYILDAVTASIAIRRKISISTMSARRIMEWHDEVNNIRKTRDYDTVKIPKNSRYKKLKMPDSCVRLTTRRQFIEEGEFQHNCVASYIDNVNEDKCSIWSMRKSDGSRNTIEIRIRKSMENPKGYFYIQQMRSFANGDVSAEDQELVRDFLTRQIPLPHAKPERGEK